MLLVLWIFVVAKVEVGEFVVQIDLLTTHEKRDGVFCLTK
jgi:hypothetical protein